jgi:ribosomal protein L17
MKQPSQAEMESMDWQQLFWVCWQALVEMETINHTLRLQKEQIEHPPVLRTAAKTHDALEARRQAVRELRKGGMSYRAIGEAMEMTYQGVYMVVNGVEHCKGKNGSGVSGETV